MIDENAVRPEGKYGEIGKGVGEGYRPPQGLYSEDAILMEF